jgi:hypothetical protein
VESERPLTACYAARVAPERGTIRPFPESAVRILLPLVPLVACTGPTVPTDGTDHTGTEPTTTFTLPPDLVLDDRDNYTFDQRWTMAATEVKANPATILVGWSAKATDAWAAARAADSFARLSLWKLSTTRSDALLRFADDTLDAVITERWDADVAGDTDTTLEALGVDVTTALAEDDAVSWMLTLADDAGPRLDVRDGLFLVPSATQPGISVTIPDGGAEVTWSAAFGTDTLRTDPGHDRYTLDFAALTVDAYGVPFDVGRIDRVFVARFDAVDEADDLGGEVLNLPAVAAGWWTVGTGGFGNVDLSLATDDAGASFPGFTPDAAWLVGGVCSSCLGPAPKFLAIVEVREP